MTEELTATSWVYVLVQDPGPRETIVGQTDPKADISFIPMFTTREAAMQGVAHMAKQKGSKYEIQAIILEDLERYALESGHIIFVLDDDGRVIEKRAPQAPTA